MAAKQWAGEAELQGLLQELCGHTTVPTSKVKQIVATCNKYVAEFKMVVYEIERFIKKANNDDKIGGVFVIDSLCRQHSKEREIFAKRFSVRLRETMSFLLKVSPQDRTTLVRLLEEWRKKSVYSPDLLGQILGDFNVTVSSSSASLLSPTKSGDGDDTGKKRSATSAGLVDAGLSGEVKKASRLCPFREGNCPYGDKCRFNHHDTNSLEQYAARLLKPLQANLPSTNTTSAPPAASAVPAVVLSEQFFSDNNNANTTTTVLRSILPSSSASSAKTTSNVETSVFDAKYWEKSIIRRLQTPQNEEDNDKNNLTSPNSLFPTEELTFHRKKSTNIHMDALPLMVTMAQPILRTAPPAEFYQISRDNLVDLMLNPQRQMSNSSTLVDH